VSRSAEPVAARGPRHQAASAAEAAASWDVAAVRSQFPILAQEIHGHPLAYLDNAASTQRPLAVLDAIERCYREYYANVHRGVHTLSQRSTDAFEAARARVAGFLGATDPAEVIFVRGTTEGINLVAQSWGRRFVLPGDEVLVTELEHHSNIVPWQLLCEERGARLRVVPIDDRGDLLLDELDRRLTERTRVVAVTHVSNAIGTVVPLRAVIERAHAAGAIVVVDGAQSAPHFRVDLEALGCDFYAFSGHKVYGPSGIGALWGRRELLEAMPPWQGGGGMIGRVTFERTTYREPPYRFEAGTPNIAGAIGLAAALDFVDGLGIEALARHESGLVARAVALLDEIPGVRVIGRPRERAAVVSFVVEGAHAHDVGTFLDHEGIAVRVGHHCAQPLMDRFGIAATSRASMAAFNTEDELVRLQQATAKVAELFGVSRGSHR
jgi:cysteine desulfurase/selenocysteine lyase